MILKRFIVRFFIIAFLSLAVLMVWQVSRFYMFLKRTSYTVKPFTQDRPNAALSILFLGDSTAVGTGAKTNNESVAGWFAKDFLNAHIDNVSRNGRKLGELLIEYDFKPAKHYDIAIVQVGGNDILRFTRLAYIRRDLPILLDRVKQIADHVVVLHSGNVGIAPIFIWPLSNVLTERTKEVRAIYQEAA